MAEKQKETWHDLNLAKAPQVQALYEAIGEAREAFEAAATQLLIKSQMVPQGKVPKFGYRFGNLAVAFVSPAGTGANKGSTLELSGDAPAAKAARKRK